MLQYYFISYTGVVLFYLIYRTFLSVCFEEKKYPKNKLFSTIIIPAYNEDERVLRKCVEKCYEAKGNKEIIVIDDGSEKKPYSLLEELKGKYGIKYHVLKQNKGKRYAQAEGIKRAKGDIIITVDSDTILDENAIEEIKRPFSDVKIGAVTGNVSVLNKDENLLTRMINARYKSAFLWERKSQSSLGIINCCCGSLSAYRADIVKKVVDDYVGQRFMGKNCNFGDDRHLSNLVLKNGYKIVFSPDAIAKTIAPNNYSKFIKQQHRWTQSFLREGLITLKFAWKNNKILAFDVFLMYIMPVFSLGVRISMIYFIFIYPISIIYFAVMIIVMALFRNIVLLTKEPKEIVYAIMYGFLHVGLIYWIYYPAWVSLIAGNKKWGTR